MDSLEQRARELLAAEYDREGVDVTASALRRGDYVNYPAYRFALAAIAAALRQSEDELAALKARIAEAT